MQSIKYTFVLFTLVYWLLELAHLQPYSAFH